MPIAKYFNVVLVCLLFSASPGICTASQSLDANESAIVAWTEAHKDEAIDLLEKLVNINSGSLNLQGVKDVGAILRSELDALEFETRWIDFPAEMQRGGHLFGKHGGDRGKKIRPNDLF